MDRDDGAEAALDWTHDPQRCSWVESANLADTDFPVQNLPFGAFRYPGSSAGVRIGVAIGDQILDLRLATVCDVWPKEVLPWLAVLAAGDLNSFMGAGSAQWQAMRRALSSALTRGSAAQDGLQRCLVPQSAVHMELPCRIGDYSDFYVGIHHATAVGRLFRPDQPLLPNYQWAPIGYHGRSSSIVVSGTPIRRPTGQRSGAAGQPPTVAPSGKLDYEVELGYLIGPGNPQGSPIPIDQAQRHLFGVTLFNDWSARDMQQWEYQPLGPFLSKSFASTLSPWVVTMAALAPFRGPLARGETDPPPLPYLSCESDRAAGALSVQLQAWFRSERMRQARRPAVMLSCADAALAAYWTPAQIVAHHTSGGCNLRPGDLLGSGTLSGPGARQAGSLLELTSGGAHPLRLGEAEELAFLRDGDEIVLRGRCERPGHRSIGFGPCAGQIQGG